MYAELLSKTAFSFLEGSSQPHELVERALQIGVPALGITDRHGVYGLPRAFAFAKNHPEFNLISGCELEIENHSSLRFLVQNREAYGLMCRMITAAHAGKEKGTAFLSRKEAEEFAAHAAAKGILVFPHEKFDGDWLKEIFNNQVFLPLSFWKDGKDRARVKKILEAEKRWGFKPIASNQALYHVPERRKLQDAFTCIKQGKTLLNAGFHLQSNAERYLKSFFEMKILYKDFPEMLTRTLQIADSCTFSLSELRYRYPSEWIPSPHSAQSYLEELTWQGARTRYGGNIPEKVRNQLLHELTLINKLNFPDYFLTIYDIVDFARSKNILCQGRGSAANSAVCYCLGITAIDPIQMDFLFERFISMERKEPPDIDVDFEHERREEVLQYVYEKYGRDRAAMVSAVITYRTRSAFRELSKAFAIDVGTLSAKKVDQEFAKLSEKCPIPNVREQIETLAESMDGFPRHLSIHSGGFTLSADPLVEIVPIEPARMEGRTIIQWDKYDLDELGLLKVDLLSLGMLSALKKCFTQTGLELHTVPQNDKATYAMIHQADTVGTFQVESRAQMNMCGRLRPVCFYDLVVQVAIVRPGPSQGQMVHPYLRRRHGLEKAEYPHPKLEEVLGKTLGVPLFQEQVMKLAIELADFTPGDADVLRRAIGAWRSSGSIHEIGKKIYEGFRRKNIPDEYTHMILERMKGFAHYGFPESHAASFAYLSYASCYMKRHFPVEFTCSIINSQPMGFYTNRVLLDDLRLHGKKILPICPHKSRYDCTVEDGALRLGWRLVRGLSSEIAEKIADGRPYKNLDDFLTRFAWRFEVLENMAMAGVFESFNLEARDALWKILSWVKPQAGAQLDFFNQAPTDQTENIFSSLDSLQKVQEEYRAFHVTLKDHPMQIFRERMNIKTPTVAEIRKMPHGRIVNLTGLVLLRQRPPTANGTTFLGVQDETGILDLTIFKREYEKNRETVLNHCFLQVRGEVQRDGNSVCMILKSVRALFPNFSEGMVIEPHQYFV